MNGFNKNAAIQGAIRTAQSGQKDVELVNMVKRLEQRVNSLERQVAATNAAALLILGEDLAQMKHDISRLKKK